MKGNHYRINKVELILIVYLLCTICVSAQIQLLNDEFDTTESLSNWQDINQTEGWNIQQLDWYNINDSIEGHFQIAPHTSGWYQEWKGALMYKEVTGDFVLTTEVLAMGRDKISVPDALYSLAGVMIRTPTNNSTGQAGWTSNNQNYIFLAVGTADNNCVGPCTGQFEVKTTTNSNSQLSIIDIPTTHVQFRFARMGSHFIILYRLMPTGDWVVHQRYNRNDFPATLQVGFTTYTDWNKVSAVGPEFHNQNVLITGVPNDPAPTIPFNSDLIADFDFYRLDSLNCPTNVNCTSPANMNNNDILSFLSYASVPFCPEHFFINQTTIDEYYINNIADTITYSSSLLDNSKMNLRSSETTMIEGSTITEGATLQIFSESCPQ